eukprot:TRINITY_DN1940_c0_g1_i3.p1 TRINITY_DN1940_c0_g1~~TRINITY_DN1940_c0_g1_i3.p1  ORF type:complete len:591 (+),score=150.05 TRINITY_DN1940_c0_g1_i3:127-1899(+)
MGDAIERLVEKATSDYLIQADWETNLRLIDMIQQEPGHAREIVRCCQKRLRMKSRNQYYALELLEALVKNCEATHQFINAREFQDDMLKLGASKKSKENVREKVLDLIQYWADSFQRRPDMQGFSRTYMELRKQGIAFPLRRKEAPLTFAAPTVAPGSARTYGGGAPPAPVQDIAIDPRNLAPVRESVNLLNEMIAFLVPENPEDDPTSNELIQEMLGAVRNAAPKLQALLQNAAGSMNESQLADLFALNDDLTRALGSYDELVAKRNSYRERGWPRQAAPPASTASAGRPNIHAPPPAAAAKPPAVDLLGDLQDIFGAPAPALSQMPPTYQPNPYGMAPAPVQAHAPATYNPFSPSQAHQPAHAPTPVTPAASEPDDFDLFTASRYSSPSAAPAHAHAPTSAPAPAISATSTYPPPMGAAPLIPTSATASMGRPGQSAPFGLAAPPASTQPVGMYGAPSGPMMGAPTSQPNYANPFGGGGAGMGSNPGMMGGMGHPGMMMGPNPGMVGGMGGSPGVMRPGMPAGTGSNPGMMGGMGMANPGMMGGMGSNPGMMGQTSAYPQMYGGMAAPAPSGFPSYPNPSLASGGRPQ